MSPPAAIPLGLPPSATLATRIDRKLRRTLTHARQRIQHATARLYFSLPYLSRRDPRRHVIKLRDYCRQTEAIPAPLARTMPHWYISVRPAESVTLKESISIRPAHAAALAAGIQRFQGGMTLRFPEVFLASVARPKLHSREFLLLSAEGQIFFESALSRGDYLEASGLLDLIRQPRPRPLPGEYCLLTNRSVGGYYHWLIEILPKLSIIEKFPRLATVPLLLPEHLTSFHRDSLAIAGVKRERMTCLPVGLWQADRITFPEMLGPTGIPSPHAVSWLRRRFLGQPATSAKPTRRRVYLTRRDATQRRVLNEAEIIDVLAAFGFEVVCPGELSFAEQVELFRQVEVVVAPHGAGLTNMVFTPPGRTFIEFFGDNYVNGCFWALAQHCGHRHAFLVGPSTWLDYHVSPADLIALLGRLGL